MAVPSVPAGAINGTIFVYIVNGNVAINPTPPNWLGAIIGSISTGIAAAAANVTTPNRLAARIDYSVDGDGNFRWSATIVDPEITLITSTEAASLTPPAADPTSTGGPIFPGTQNPGTSNTLGTPSPVMATGKQLVVRGSQIAGTSFLIVSVNDPIALSISSVLDVPYSDGTDSGPIYHVTAVAFTGSTVNDGLVVRQTVMVTFVPDLVQDVNDLAQVGVS